jgi:hypothetical protein
MKKDKPEKMPTAREAAQDFIRPFVLKGEIMLLHSSSAKFRHATENYSAHIEGEHIAITFLYGKEIKELFPLEVIIHDITTEQMYQCIQIPRSAKEAYELKREEIMLLLERLKGRLKQHAKKFKQDSTNWDYTGDLANLSRTLEEVLLSLR